MNRVTQNFAENNYTIAADCQCHPCINVGGWKNTLQKSLLRTSAAPIVFVSFSVAAGFRRYTCVWRNYFEDAINLGIGGDCVKNVLWRAQDTSLLDAASFVVIHCSTNNINQNQPKDIAGRILKIVKPLPRNILKKYHQYWLVAKGQDIMFLANNTKTVFYRITTIIAVIIFMSISYIITFTITIIVLTIIISIKMTTINTVSSLQLTLPLPSPQLGSLSILESTSPSPLSRSSVQSTLVSPSPQLA